VLRALGLGDLLTGVPALRGLRRAFPAHRIALAAPAPLAPLARVSGTVDEVLGAAPLAPLPSGARGAEVAVNLHGRGPQSHRVLLDAAPGRLIAFAHPEVPESAGGPQWHAGEHEIARWCRMLAEHGIPADPGDLELTLPPGPAPPPQARGATLVHPGAASGARRWPVARWAEVARAEAAAGRTVLVTGGPEEAPLALELARRAGLPEHAVHAGRTGLLELAALVATAGRVLCGDTGLAHLATALGTPSVVLFGPTPPAEWGPPAEPWHRALWAGRRGDPHATEPDPGLLALSVSDVLAAASSLPESPAGERRGGPSPDSVCSPPGPGTA